MITLSIEEFAARRRNDQTQMEADLFAVVSEAVDRFPAQGWYDDLLREVARLYVDTYHREGGKGQPSPSAREFVADVRATLDKTKDPTSATPERISTWLSTAILNAGTQAAAEADAEFIVMEWVTMHDKDVRSAHVRLEGQQQPPGEPFTTDGVRLRYPGDPTAPIDMWINCRCTLAPVAVPEPAIAASQGVTMTDTDTEPEVEREPLDVAQDTAPVAWHGVLVPEGAWSGDKRRFAPESLTWRDLPLPLTWQKASADGHEGSVTIGDISAIERVDGMMQGSGTFLSTPEADEVVGLVAHFGRFGVSIDADASEFDMSDPESDELTFTSARICSASVVPIPAFQEAYITLGPWADEALAAALPPPEQECDPEADPNCPPPKEPAYALDEFVSDKPWSDFTAADYTPEQWKSACCLHRAAETEPKSNHGLPIKEPGGALNRNGVHAAAARFNQVSAPAEAKSAAKSCLRGAYKQIGEEPPDVLKAAVELPEHFGRGPGWVTHPKETRRIHAYWTQPGQPGYAKINWGVPGDFNRCRLEVGEEIGENSPDKLRFINQICAQWHHDALGFWPGRAPTEQAIEGEPAQAVNLVASGGHCAPSEWFADPHLAALTPLTITEAGRVFGHLAGWQTCHTGMADVCVAPPRSPSNYAYFLTGEVETDAGMVPVGNITIGGGHAAPNLRAKPALAHYDSATAVVADVTCGEDEHGIWLAGWVRPGVDDEAVTALRASSLSGDWRRIAGELELIAALAVNSPGFPVPRVGVRDAQQVALVAAGAVQATLDDPAQFVRQIADVVIEELSARQSRREKMAQIAARIGD